MHLNYLHGKVDNEAKRQSWIPHSLIVKRSQTQMEFRMKAEAFLGGRKF